MSTLTEPCSLRVQHLPRLPLVLRQRSRPLHVQLQFLRHPNCVARPAPGGRVVRLLPVREEDDRLDDLDRTQSILDCLPDQLIGQHEAVRVRLWTDDLGCDGEDGGEEEGGAIPAERRGVKDGIEDGDGDIEVAKVADAVSRAYMWSGGRAGAAHNSNNSNASASDKSPAVTGSGQSSRRSCSRSPAAVCRAASAAMGRKAANGDVNTRGRAIAVKSDGRVQRDEMIMSRRTHAKNPLRPG